MGENTAISWTDDTFSPWWGCQRVSPGCEHCYAEAFAKRVGDDVWGKTASRRVIGDATWLKPLKWNREAEAAGVRRRVFCASMCDVFEDHEGPMVDHKGVVLPGRSVKEERLRLWLLIALTPWLDWQLLTKRPENVNRMVPIRWLAAWPGNVWMGTTVEDQKRADERIPELLQIDAKVRFLSCEPLLGPVDLGLVDHTNHERDYLGNYSYLCLDCSTEDEELRWFISEPTPIDWVIVGGESGPKHRPLNLDHARSLRDQCEAAGVAFFFKQVGGRTPTAGGDLLDGVAHKAFPR